METKKYNVYIVEYKTDKAVSRWASNLNEKRADNAEEL
jgi:hypothetical protein